MYCSRGIPPRILMTILGVRSSIWPSKRVREPYYNTGNKCAQKSRKILDETFRLLPRAWFSLLYEGPFLLIWLGYL